MMGEPCGTYEGVEKCRQDFSTSTQKEDPLEELKKMGTYKYYVTAGNFNVRTKHIEANGNLKIKINYCMSVVCQVETFKATEMEIQRKWHTSLQVQGTQLLTVRSQTYTSCGQFVCSGRCEF